MAKINVRSKSKLEREIYTKKGVKINIIFPLIRHRNNIFSILGNFADLLKVKLSNIINKNNAAEMSTIKWILLSNDST